MRSVPSRILVPSRTLIRWPTRAFPAPLRSAKGKKFRLKRSPPLELHLMLVSPSTVLVVVVLVIASLLFPQPCPNFLISQAPRLRSDVVAIDPSHTFWLPSLPRAHGHIKRGAPEIACS